MGRNMNTNRGELGKAHNRLTGNERPPFHWGIVEKHGAQIETHSLEVPKKIGFAVVTYVICT
eukprot:11548509-Ditylum_brightwellii.AAC.1